MEVLEWVKVGHAPASSKVRIVRSDEGGGKQRRWLCCTNPELIVPLVISHLECIVDSFTLIVILFLIVLFILDDCRFGR